MYIDIYSYLYIHIYVCIYCFIYTHLSLSLSLYIYRYVVGHRALPSHVQRAFDSCGASLSFWIFIICLDMTGVLMMIVALLASIVGLLQQGVASGCENAPLLSDDEVCTASFVKVGLGIGVDLIAFINIL